MVPPLPSSSQLPAVTRPAAHGQITWRAHLAWWSLRARAWWRCWRGDVCHPAVELLARGDTVTLDRLLADLDADGGEPPTGDGRP